MCGPGHSRFGAATAADHGPGSGEIPASLLGLDIGGSASRARLRTRDSLLIEVSGPGANIATLDSTLVDHRLSALLKGVSHAHPEACCAGAAGAEVPAARVRLEKLLQRMLPGSRVAVVHDARLVLAAAGVQTGIALIAGTGSVVYGRATDGGETQRGGWGWMLGDEGGGTWIAREAAREVMARTEAGRPIGPLGESMLIATEAADARQMSAALHAMREPAQWAAIASVVFRSAASDAGSREIIDAASVALAALVAQVQDSLGVEGPVVLAGGLLLNQPLLESAVRERLGTRCVRLDEPPVAGALRIAEEMLRQ